MKVTQRQSIVTNKRQKSSKENTMFKGVYSHAKGEREFVTRHNASLVEMGCSFELWRHFFVSDDNAVYSVTKGRETIWVVAYIRKPISTTTYIEMLDKLRGNTAFGPNVEIHVAFFNLEFTKGYN